MKPRFLISACLVLLLCNACASSESTQHKKKPIKKSALDALRHQGTWAPALGASVIALSGKDHETSDWAIENKPLFGSHIGADNAANDSRSITHLGMIISGLAVKPDPEHNRKTGLELLVYEHVGTYIPMKARDAIIVAFWQSLF